MVTASKNIYFYVGMFLYNVKYVKLGHANFSWAFGVLVCW